MDRAFTPNRWVGIVVSLFVAGCGGGTIALEGTQRAPGADGTVDLGEVEGNVMARVEVRHLPPPSRVGQGLTCYVLWLRAPDGSRQSNAGVMQYDEGDRVGRVTGITPMRVFEVLITAERAANSASPGPDVVFQRRVQADD